MGSDVSAETLAYITLSLIDGIGGARVKALLAHFGSAAAVLNARAADLRVVSGIGAKLSSAIERADPARVVVQLQGWAERGVRALPLMHPAFPAALRVLSDPPATLFVLGEWPNTEQPPFLRHAYAVVGTRKPGETARDMAMAQAFAWVSAGACVVSGLALGIDGAAHLGALAGARPGQVATVAVLGGGVLRVFPPEHADLARQIVRQGALVCECAPDARTTTPGLVARNRMIAGLVPTGERGGLLVAESAHDGGAMYAARRAQALGKRIFTLDLPASGNQALLNEGIPALAGPYPVPLQNNF